MKKIMTIALLSLAFSLNSSLTNADVGEDFYHFCVTTSANSSRSTCSWPDVQSICGSYQSVFAEQYSSIRDCRAACRAIERSLVRQISFTDDCSQVVSSASSDCSRYCNRMR